MISHSPLIRAQLFARVNKPAVIIQQTITHRSNDKMVAEQVGAGDAPIEIKPVSNTPAPGAWLTVERGLYGLILIVAAFLRCFALGAQPLSPLEAANAWPAWVTALAVTVPSVEPPTSPLLHSLHTLLFWLTTGGDAVARVFPALAGLGLVLLAWWWRDWLGRPAALLLALFLAIDPWLVALSRLVDGGMLSLALSLLALTGLSQLRSAAPTSQVHQRWGYITALAIALLLISGALAWSLVPVLFLFGQFFARSAGSEAKLSADNSLVTGLPAQSPELAVNQQGNGELWLGIPRLAWLTGGVAALLGSTTWLAQPENLGLISRSFSTWITYLSGAGPDTYPLSWPFLRLWVDNPLLLVFGGLGMIQLWLTRLNEPADAAEAPAGLPTTNPAWRWFLTGWVAWGLLLLLLPGRNPLQLPLLGLPLALAAATTAASLVRTGLRNLPWLESGLLLGVLTVLLTFFTFSAWFLLAQWQWEMRRALVLLLFLALAVLLILIFALWSNWSQARIVVGSYVGLLLLIVTWSSTWQLNHWGEPGELNGFFARFTDPDVRRLAADVHTLSAQRVGDATQMPILVQMAAQPDPVLGWYLRDMYNLRWVLAPALAETAGQSKPLVITLGPEPSNDQQLVNYMGSHYALRGRWLPTDLTAQTAAPAADPTATTLGARLERFWSNGARVFLRWVVYRKVPVSPPTEQVVLWVGQ